jgi:hypothetical protein
MAPPLIDHPPSQPLRYRIAPNLHLPERRRGLLLRFRSPECPPCGATLELQIAVRGEVHTFHGEVAHVETRCRPRRVQVWIHRRDESFMARMVEQLCHIAHYRQRVVQRQGRELSEEEAASEWIARYAEWFPAN